MKGILKIFLLFGAAVSFSQETSAQIRKIKHRDRIGDSVVVVNTQEKEVRVKGPKALTKEHAIGARINTDGWGLYFNYGLIKKNEGKKSEIDRFYDVLYFQLEIGERYHPKEYRDFRGGMAAPFRNYFLSILSTDMFKFGKINNFYTAKLGLGYKYLLAGKPEAKTVSIHWNTNGGLALAFLKPYYFSAVGGDKFALDPEAEDLINVLARTDFSKGWGYRDGWSELKVVPGIYARTGLKLDYADRRQRLAGLEVGVGAEFYTSRIHQMALQGPQNFFVNAFVGFELGWKR